jgi:hypothetical protein
VPSGADSQAIPARCPIRPLGAVHVANRVIEWFVPIRHFALVIAPVLLMIALPDAVGSVAWERTWSIVLSVLAGVRCAMVAMLVGLCFAFPSSWHSRRAQSCGGMRPLRRAA